MTARQPAPQRVVSGCQGMRRAYQFSRRTFLQAGTLSLLGAGLGAAELSAPVTSAGGSLSFGRAKRCIFFFMWGGPSQLDTFDLKPRAPAEIRGPFQPIATTVAGLQICQHFPLLAQQAHRLAVVRTLHHSDPAHLSSGHLALTGHLAPVINSDAAPPSDRDSPHMGSVLARLRPATGELPNFVTLPWFPAHPAAPGGRAPGQNGGWLGRRYDPFLLLGDPNQPDWGIPELTLPSDMTSQRLSDRCHLLETVDAQRKELEQIAVWQDLDGLQQRAIGLLASAETRKAFDLKDEPTAVRERYGRHIHGQGALLARRLIEHGVPFVSLNWHDDGRNFWDTHTDNFRRLEHELIPPADRALSALLSDLSERGLLDETLVVWVGEFGRRPQIAAAHAGREHWPYCYSGLLAGGGVHGGAVWGKSDAQAARPAVDPVRPQDFSATILHALGIEPATTVPDRGGRPIMLCDGQPLCGLLG